MSNSTSNSKLCISKRNLLLGTIVFVGLIVIIFTNFVNSQRINTNSRAEGLAPTNFLVMITPNPYLEPTAAIGERRTIKCLDQKPEIYNSTNMIGLYLNSGKNENGTQDLMPTPSIMMYIYRYQAQTKKHTVIDKKLSSDADKQTLKLLRVSLTGLSSRDDRYYYSQLEKLPGVTLSPTITTSQWATFDATTPAPTITSIMEQLDRCIKID